MRHHHVPLFALLAAAAACGGSPDKETAVELPGLDERPANLTCLAPPKPTNAAGDPFPATLSATGCGWADDPTWPSPGMIPYSVNAALWSDGADKERFLAIPDGGKIRIGSDGDWDFPNGTVLIKTFRFDGKRIETRLFMRHGDGEWAGYSYEWNSDETDATLVPDGGKSRMVGKMNDVEWTYPSRSDCTKCHTAQAGFSLGLETAQLNRTQLYSNGRRANQLVTFAHIGLFDAPLTGPVDKLPRLADPSGSDGTPTERARAYLHGNCANCHRPGVVPDVDLDLRATIALADTHGCDVVPIKGSIGLGPGGKLIAPGHRELPMLPLRMQLLNSNRMPPVASSIVDSDGVRLVEGWIAAMKDCR
jgi:uncharacterized repeat protein (TIGR03806 family)